LDTIQAGILSVKLKHLDTYSSARNDVADRYDQAFAGHPSLLIPIRAANSTHVFHQYTLRLAENIDREEFKKHLADKGIPTMVYYPLPLHLQKAYLEYGGKEGQFPVAEKLCKQVISLPIHTEMEEDQQNYIIDQILNFF
jgi:dTDP-4-amino-4,6-dideoxygalactose transaminase